MKNKLFNLKKLSKLLYCFGFIFLFAHATSAQKTFTWNGSANSSWANTANWTISGSGGTSTYPGENATTDLVIINNGVVTAPVVFVTVPNAIEKLTINNANSSATLTINSGATLAVTTALNNPVVLNGGNIVNNGTLDVKTTITAVVACGISCGNPTIAPGSATTFGYSGSGTLNIDIAASNTFNSSAIIVSGVNTNTTYRFLFNGAPNIKLSNTNTATFAVRAAGAFTGAEQPAKVLIGGAGFTLGSVATPVFGGLFSIIGGNNVTVDTGTVLTLNSLTGNLTNGIDITNALTPSMLAASFTNKGTINIAGSTARNGLYLSPSSIATLPVINFENQNIININIFTTIVNNAALQVANIDINNTPGTVNITNTAAAVMTLRNNQPQSATGFGCPIRIFGNVNTANVNLTNTGTLNLNGNDDSFGGNAAKSTLTNNGTVNANNNFINIAVTNNATGILNFSQPNATFTVPSGAAATAGDIYTDVAGSSYVVLATKIGGIGTVLHTTKQSSAAGSVAITTLTKISGAGDNSITSSAAATPISAIATATSTNNGTINTGKGVESLSRLFGVLSSTAASTIAPGGASEKGIANFSGLTHTIAGKLILQVAGNTKAGVDYDQITNTNATGVLNVSGAVLDLTGIYTPAGPGPVTINVITVSVGGTLSGTLGTPIGLTPGWSVVTTNGTGGKVALVYTVNQWTGTTSTVWTDSSNWSTGVPSASSNVTIGIATNQPTIASNVVINSLAIASGATLTVNEGMVLDISGIITNSGDLILKSSATGTASLLNTSAAPNVTQQRYLSSNQRGWRLLSNPLASTTFNAVATASNITIGSNYTGQYISAADTWTSTDGSASFNTQNAYKVFITGLSGESPAYNAGPSNVTISYKGTATNTAPSTISTVSGQFYLVANPYTAPVSLTSIIAASTGLSNTVSYYNPTKAATNAKINAGGYNAIAVSGAAGSVSDVVLPPMGAIFVQASSGGTINIPKTAIFTGTVQGGTYNQKTAQAKTVASVVLTLDIVSNGIDYDNLQLQFKDVGTIGNNIDFGKLPNSLLDFYSINKGALMSVSELELKEQIIALGISSKQQKNYTIKVSENNIPAGYEAVLVDNVLNTKTVLNLGTNYNFAIDGAPTTQGNARFAINLKVSGSLSLLDTELDSKIQLWPNPAHGQLNIINGQDQKDGTSTIEISNLNGQIIHSHKSNPGTTTAIQTKGWASGVYIVKVKYNGNQSTKKLIVK